MGTGRPRHEPRLATLRSLRECAQRWGKSYQTMLRIFHQLRRQDEEGGIQESQKWWIVVPKYNRSNAKNYYLINLLKLRAAHPSLFSAHYVSKEEAKDHGERIARLEEELIALRKRVNGHGSKLRELDGMRDTVESLKRKRRRKAAP